MTVGRRLLKCPHLTGGDMAKPKKASAIQQFITDHGAIEDFAHVFAAATPRPAESASRKDKHGYAVRLSAAAAVLFAAKLRPFFPGVLPHPDGTGGESPARTGKGVKKLDVNYSTPQLGLGLGVSIKTLNYRDAKTKRYTKNPTRLDNELRAEAMDYHDRQPFAVMVAVLLLPVDACDDGDPKRPKSSWSSFAQIVSVLRHRVNRPGPREEPQLFERGFVGLYQHAGTHAGDVLFFDMMQAPPQFGRPTQLYDLEGVVQHIVNTYDLRNTVKRPWETEADAVVPFAQLLAEDRLEGEEADEDDEPEA